MRQQIHDKRSALIRQILDWKNGSEAPVDEDQSPLPLRALILYSEQRKIVAKWACDPKMDHVKRTDEILARASEYAESMTMAGEPVRFSLEPMFGNNMETGQAEYVIVVRPSTRVRGDVEQAGMLMDFRDPRNRDAAEFRENRSLVRESFMLAAGSSRDIIDRLMMMLDRANNRISELEAEREKTWGMQQKLMDHQLDRELKYRREDVQLRVMEAAGSKIVGYLPLLLKSVDDWIAKRAGAKNLPEDEASEYRQFAKLLLSKFGDAKTAKKIFDAMDLSDAEVVKVVNMGKSLAMEENRQKLTEEANAGLKGLPSALPFRSLPRKVGE